MLAEAPGVPQPALETSPREQEEFVDLGAGNTLCSDVSM